MERVRAALAAAAARPAAPLVRDACFDAAERSAGRRVLAAVRACRAIARGDAASVRSCFSAFNDARDRLVIELLCTGARLPRARSRDARFRTDADALPGRGGGKLTPARLAFDSPMAMACLVERAPWIPALMWSISSLMNSPA
jgi:hypothetical protein